MVVIFEQAVRFIQNGHLLSTLAQRSSATHCFERGESGTAISFLMEYSNLGFMNAVEELASLAGMQFPTNQSTNSNYGDTTRLIELMEQVQAAFKEELLSSESESVVKSYIRSRQFTPQTIMHFGVGFAPDRWDYVLKKFGRSKSGLSLLHKAGLVIRNEKDREYDRFRN